MAAPTFGQYLDITTVAYLYGTSASALYIQRHRGQNPGSLGVLVGRKLLWKKDELDAWFDSQRNKDRP